MRSLRSAVTFVLFVLTNAVKMERIAALTATLLLLFASGMSFAAERVIVTNGPTTPVPVSGTVGISGPVGVSGTVGVSGAVSVTNTQASPLYVAAPPSAALTTSLKYSNTITIQLPGTLAFGPIDVKNCSQIRVGVITSFTGDTVAVTVFNELGIQLDEFIVGTALGSNATTGSRVYEIPGLSLNLWLTPQNVQTGRPITFAVWCR